jgi:hypothetical protein
MTETVDFINVIRTDVQIVDVGPKRVLASPV